MAITRGQPLTLPHPGGGRYLNPNIGEPRLDPPEPPEHWIDVEQLAPGVWAVVDQDGELVRGPVSTRADAEWELGELERELHDRYLTARYRVSRFF